MFIGMLAVLGIFFVCPITIFGFIHLGRKMKIDVKKLEYQQTILAMELKKEQLILERMSLENKMLDKQIEQIENNL
jgi:hypothetical protein